MVKAQQQSRISGLYHMVMGWSEQETLLGDGAGCSGIPRVVLVSWWWDRKISLWSEASRWEFLGVKRVPKATGGTLRCAISYPTQPGVLCEKRKNKNRPYKGPGALEVPGALPAAHMIPLRIGT